MRITQSGGALLWLTTTAAVLTFARADISASGAALHDALSSAALPPIRAADIPPVDADSWSALLAHARKVAQNELHDQGWSEGVQVVRETFYVPLQPKVGEPLHEREEPRLAPSAEQTVARPTQEVSEPANILRTIGKLRVLRPLFVYAIHHPLRFLYAYALLPLLSLLLSLLLSVSSLLLSLLATLLSPFRFLLSTLFLRPLAALLSLAVALTPLWYALAGALACGAGCGVLAGRIAGHSTRSAIDQTVDTATRAARWLGVLSQAHGPRDQTRRGQKTPGSGGGGDGARLERFRPSATTASSSTGRGAPRGGSSAATSWSSSASPSVSSSTEKSRGKRRAVDTSASDFSAYASSSGVKYEEGYRASWSEDDVWGEQKMVKEEEKAEGQNGVLGQTQATTRPSGSAQWRDRRVPY